MSTLDMREVLYALVEYAGPLDDPRIGWAYSNARLTRRYCAPMPHRSVR